MPSNLRVVVDTNIFISSFFGGIPKEIIDLWKNGKIILCLSQNIIEEYLNVLNRLRRQDEKKIQKLTKLFAAKTPKITI
jgi:putative PIN family toxin of toxin-antitoxin system